MVRRRRQFCGARRSQSTVAAVLFVHVLLLAVGPLARPGRAQGGGDNMSHPTQDHGPHIGAPAGRAPAHGFTGLKTEGKGSFTLPFPVDRVFPLFGPVEEAKWAADWSPTWIYPDPVTAAASRPARGWTWLTSADDPNNTRTWQVGEYDADACRVVYHVFHPGRAVYRIEVRATPLGSGTRTDVHYELVGLSDEGNRFVQHRVAHFDQEMEEWKALIEYHLRTGKSRPPQ
jgi:hypothetical protein